MNSIQLADFQHLLDSRDLLNPSRFWCDFMKSRVEINQRFGENLLHWSQDVRKKMNNIGQNEKSPHLQQFLESYIRSTELEAYNILSQSHQLTIHKVKKMTTPRKLSSKHENLSLQLDSLTKQHMGTVRTLKHFQETGLTNLEAHSDLQDRLQQLEKQLQEMEKTDVGRGREIEEEIRSLELKLQKQRQKEQQHKLQFENLMKEEQHVLHKLQQTSDLACQEVCDLQQSQIQALVSSLRDFVVKTDLNSSSVISDRSRPLLKALDQVNVDLSQIVNTCFDLTCKSYIVPDVQVWHKTFGFLPPLPKPLIRGSEISLSQNPKKAESPDFKYANAVWKTFGSTIPSRKLWTPKSGGSVINSCQTSDVKLAAWPLASADDVPGRVTSPESCKDGQLD